MANTTGEGIIGMDGIPMPPSPYSETQLRVLATLPSILAPFSVVAATLLLSIIHRRQMYRSIYGRLMGALSISMIITTSWWMLGPVPAPTTSFGGRGNLHTCAANGFFFQLGVNGAVYYDLFIMVYFFLTICGGVTEDWIAKCVEPFFHAFSILASLGSGIAGLILTVYNPVGVGGLKCWIGSAPLGCDIIPWLPCERGEKANTFLWVTILIPCILLYVVSNVCAFSVYAVARRRMMESRSRFGTTSTFQSFRTVEQQTILYALFFFLTNGISIVIPLASQFTDLWEHPDKVYPAQVIFEILFPLQGVLVLIVFLFPRFKEVARRNPRAARLSALKHALFSRRASSQIVLPSKPLHVGENEEGGHHNDSGGGERRQEDKEEVLERQAAEDYSNTECTFEDSQRKQKSFQIDED